MHCGHTDPRVLQVDHLHGGGSAHRKKIGASPITLFKAIKENPDQFQLLCANCNWVKRAEEKEHLVSVHEEIKPDPYAYNRKRREYAVEVIDQLLSGELSRYNAIERLKVVIF